MDYNDDIPFKLHDDWKKYDPAEYKVVSVLGKGRYGSVHLVKKRDTNPEQLFAIKIIQSPDNLKYVEDEIGIMFEFNHPCLCPLIGCHFDENEFIFSLLVPYYSNKSIDNCIKSDIQGKPPQWWTIAKKMKALYGIAAGMNCMHKKGVFHRDLKPGNILLDDKYEVVISDFGFAKHHQNQLDHTAGVGTPYYMAPEIIKGSRYDQTVDIYSYSIIMFEILLAKNPYPNFKNMPLYHILNHISQGARPKIDADFPYGNNILKLMKSCWNDLPILRPSFQQILLVLYEHAPKFLNPVDQKEFYEYANRVTPHIDYRLKQKELLSKRKRVKSVASPHDLIKQIPSRETNQLDNIEKMIFNSHVENILTDVIEVMKIDEPADDTLQFNLPPISPSTNGIDKKPDVKEQPILLQPRKPFNAPVEKIRPTPKVKISVPMPQSDKPEPVLLSDDLFIADPDELNQEDNEILRKMKSSADKGDSEQMYNYAMFLHIDQGETNTFNQTVYQYMEKAASNNYPDALFWLGSHYLLGKDGYEQDYLKARKYLQSAADYGNVRAQILVGLHYIRGIDAEVDEIDLAKHSWPRDPLKGFNYYIMAANSGDSAAAKKIAEYMDQGMVEDVPVPKDQNMVNDFYRIAAENGSTQSQIVYALRMDQGKTQNIAGEFMRRAAMERHPVAMYYYGTYLLEGSHGFHKDEKRGIQFIKVSAEANQKEAMQKYAKILEKGNKVAGVKKDKATAKLYRDKLAKMIP